MSDNRPKIYPERVGEVEQIADGVLRVGDTISYDGHLYVRATNAQGEA